MSSNQVDAKKEAGRALGRLIIWIAVYIIVSAIVNSYLPSVLNIPAPGAQATNSTAVHYIFSFKTDVLEPYGTYINIVLALVFGFLIVRSLANFMYWTMMVKYPHSTASAIKNITEIIGIGGLLASIAGGVAGGAAGVALGGFIGLVVGFASQQILGQAMAGLFLLVTRPFKHGDYVNIVSEQGTVQEINSLFTVVKKDDGTTVLIPNNSIIGNKIYLLKPPQPQQQQQQKQ